MSVYDPRNRLTSVRRDNTLLASYGYDGNNLRTRRWVNDSVIYSIHDTSGNLLAELNAQGTVIREFVYLDGERIALFERNDLDGANTFPVTVTTSNTESLAGARVAVLNADNLSENMSATTSARGTVSFDRASFSPGWYRFQISYLDAESLSPPVDVADNAGLLAWLDIALEQVTVHVMLDGAARAGAVVMVCSKSGKYLGLQGTTNTAGDIVFNLIRGSVYTFRVLYKGAFYRSNPYTVLTGGGSVIVDDSRPAGRMLSPGILSLLLGKNGPGASTLAAPFSFAAADAGQDDTMFFSTAPGSGSVLTTTEWSGTAFLSAPGYGDGQKDLSPAQVTGTFEIVPFVFRVYYYINDHLGTPQMIVDEQKNVVWQADYHPFGRVEIAAGGLENTPRFPGQYFNPETGLHYNWNRFYDPGSGRYITADPIGLEGGINLYAYVRNDPVNRVDPMGLTESDGSGLWGGGLDEPSVSRPIAGPFGTICGAEGSKLAKWIPDITPRACQRHDDCYDNCASNCYGEWCRISCDLILGISNPSYGGATFYFGKPAYNAAKEKYGCGECNE